MAIVPKKRAVDAAAPVPAPILRPEIQPRARVRAKPPANDEMVAAAVMTSATPSPDVVAPEKSGYEVGYKKPPKHTQFKEGQSGNKKGRPKGAKGLKTILLKVMKEKVSVRTTAGTKRMPKVEALMHKLTEKAFSGDMRACQTILRHYDSSVADDLKREVTAANDIDLPSDAHDKAILSALARRVRYEGAES